MINYLLYGAFLVFLYFFGKWFFDPYFRYRNRRKVKEYVLFENGKQIEVKGGDANLLDSKRYDFDLTIVVPAYNEEKRLPTMMKETVEYIEKKQKEGKLFRKVELVIVNDGSKDGTSNLIREYSAQYTMDKSLVVRGVSLLQNQGKGAAVKYGCLFSRGQYVLFADADGATDINSLEIIIKECKMIEINGLACAIGSRYEEDSNIQRKPFRRFLSWGMNQLVKMVLRNNIKDTQCGFKIFTREAAKRVFPTQHLERWAFDIEVLLLCGAKNIPVKETPVNWQEIDGSHLNVVDATIQMARDMILIKFLYTLRLWGYNDIDY